MPDFHRNEETENRTHSLCLYGDVNATKSNRCKNCPRRAESGVRYQQRRCPLDYGDIFSPITAAAGQTSGSIDPKLLATSSNLQHGLEPLAKKSDKIADEIADKIADISLDGLKSSRKYRRLSRPVFDGSSPSMDKTAYYSLVEVGDKRKAGQEPESSLRVDTVTDVYDAHNGASHDQTEAVQYVTPDKLGVVPLSSDIDTKRMEQNKRPKVGINFAPDNFAPDVLGLFSTFRICSDSSPVHTGDERDMSISVPQVEIGIEALNAADSLNDRPGVPLTELRRGGSKALWNGDLEKYYRNKPQIPFQDLCKDEPLFPRWSWIGSSPFEHASSRRCLTLSSDGTLQEEGHSLVDFRIPGVAMSTEAQGVAPCNDEVFLFRDFMVGEENSELSIDQIEERRIDGSV